MWGRVKDENVWVKWFAVTLWLIMVYLVVLTFQGFQSDTSTYSACPLGGSIVIGAHWNTQNTSKYTCIVMYFAVFCVFQWVPTTILPPLPLGG